MKGGEIMEIGSIQNYSAYSSYQASSKSSSQSTDFEAVLQNRTAKLERAIDSGEIDTAKMQEQLQSVFGDSINDAFGEDGSVDVEKLEEIMQSQMGSMPGGMEGMPPPGGMGGMEGMEGMPPPPPPPDGMGGMSGSSMSSGSSINTEDFQTQLIEMFGEEAEGIVKEDGTIDTEKLSELAEAKMESQSNTTQNAFGILSTNSSFNLPVFINAQA